LLQFFFQLVIHINRLQVQSLQKNKNFHAKTQSRKGTAKKNFADSLRLRAFA